MKKRLLSFALTICMVLAMMPGMSITASAVEDPTSYPIWVNNVQVTSANKNDVLGGTDTGATVVYDSAGNTLTLNNAVITSNYSSSSTTAAIYADGNLNIVLQGNNTAVGSGDTSNNSYGIYVDGTVSISGSGALTAKGGKTTGTSVVSCGIYGRTGVNISGEAAVTALGGTVIANSGNTSCGIYGPASISGGKVVALGGAANISDNITNGMSYGIYTVNPDTIAYTGGLLVAKGGYATTCQAINYAAKDGGNEAVAKSGVFSSKYVIYDKDDTYTVLTTNQRPAGDYTLNNTIIVGEDKTPGGYSALTITPDGTLTLQGFNVVLGGEAGYGNSYTIFGKGLMTIAGNGTLVTIGGTGSYSAGISCQSENGSHLNIAGGIITAIGGAASSSSYGIHRNVSFSLSGGHLTAIGGACKIDPSGFAKSIGVIVYNYTNFSGNSKGIAIGDTIGAGYNIDFSSPLGALVTSGSWNASPTVSWEGRYKSATPVATETTVNKIAETQTSVSFALTNSPVYADVQSWNVYTNFSGNSLATGITASNTGNTLTLTHAADVPAGTYYVAVTEDGKGESYRLALTVVYLVAEAMPTAGTDYRDEKLTEVSPSAIYIVNGDEITANGDGTITIDNNWFDTTITLVKKGNGTTTTNSAVQSIALAARPTTPACIAIQPSAGSATGTITGITTAMEYSTDNGSSWTTGTGSDVTGLLAPGTVLIRVKAVTGSAPASLNQTITITAYSTPPSGGGGGSSSKTPTIITKIESGESVVSTNLDNLVKEGKKLTVEGKSGEKLVFDTEALKNIDGQTKDSVKVEIKDVSTNYKNEHPDRLVVSLTITAGGKHITSFGKGTATVSLPYELKEGEKAEDVTVWYLAEDGAMTEVPCTYDAITKLATFKVNHFSLYVVGTADTGKWTNPFSDVNESSWFYDAVRYVSANGLMNGTTDTAFNPNAKTTRGMIVTILWRMENEPKAAKDITFTDVKNGRYYHDAVAWASEKGIVGGYSAEEFGPENDITREQLAVILHNYAASKGYNMIVSGTPSGDASGDLPANLSAFSDAGKIHKWGKDAMSWANAEGLINGTESNLLDPAGAAQRSQVAAILQRFIENTVK